MPTIVRETPRAAVEESAVLRFAEQAVTRRRDPIAVEEPLEIRLNGWRWLVTMRTPGDDADLVVGLLASEGVIGSADDVETIAFRRHPEEPDLANVADVEIRRPLGEVQERITRHQTLATSSCGLCGASSVEAVLARRPALSPGATVETAVFAALPDRLASAQPGFRATGGLHAAALFDAAGALLAAREDVGRHNATDKVLGWRLRDPAGTAAAILMVSGRASFEIVQKALAAGIPVVAAVSAPSSLAVALAREGGLTLAGFVREGAFTVYTGGHRLVPSHLELVPRGVRDALDSIARTISLGDWQALDERERRELAVLAGGPADAFRTRLETLVRMRTGAAPRPLRPRSGDVPG